MFEARSALRLPLLALLMVLAAGLVLAACGGDDDDNSDGGEGGRPGSSVTAGGAATGGDSALAVSSDSFDEGGTIPEQFTCDGANISPRLTWEGMLEGTETFALIMDDPDAPRGTFTHWLIYDMPASVTGVVENQRKEATTAFDAPQGQNDAGDLGYTGPCPPEGDEPHTYRITLYALDTTLGLEPGASRDELESAMEGHVIASASTTATFGR